MYWFSGQCQKVVTKQAVQVFGWRLRRYILAYHAIEKAKEEQINTDAPLQSKDGDLVYLPAMSLQLVEQMVTPKKSLRNIADSERKILVTVHYATEKETFCNISTMADSIISLEPP